MNNRIQNNPGLQYIATRPLNDSAASHQASSGANRSSASGSDRVSLSARADRLNQLVDIAKSAPDVNQSRVDALKNAIANGDYQVDAENVAANMLGIESSFQDG